jgi:hypothetical protein
MLLQVSLALSAAMERVFSYLKSSFGDEQSPWKTTLNVATQLDYSPGVLCVAVMCSWMCQFLVSKTPNTYDLPQ